VAVLDDMQYLREACGVSGEIDVAVSGAVGRKLLTVATATDGAVVELDCAELTFIDASGVTMLLDVANRSGKQVRLVNLIPCCRRVFEILDLDEQFGIDRPALRGAPIRIPLEA